MNLFTTDRYFIDSASNIWRVELGGESNYPGTLRVINNENYEYVEILDSEGGTISTYELHESLTHLANRIEPFIIIPSSDFLKRFDGCKSQSKKILQSLIIEMISFPNKKEYFIDVTNMANGARVRIEEHFENANDWYYDFIDGYKTLRVYRKEDEGYLELDKAREEILEKSKRLIKDKQISEKNISEFLESLRQDLIGLVRK